ncbi:50S ribosomal protein L3 N(5)-glutamine methyltransferase [Suttonella ornithocola]|uniref:50S ribosomal protein L3 glutamine methyltransferase n=1 Tax=Suttonella ornithocola TaxID=279832 RepID=A0A380MYC2_9GAMM|nr:50S ribosomal protein L3 N(5)-glutamine methyltransferase [Suttonella ornithocola]SUO97288.1 50S ribosomal protein L3 glutamine methyltransferase [Suttonella ornithocola]
MKNLLTVLDWIRYGASRLAESNVYYGHGTDNALDESAALVLGMLKLPFDISPTYFQAHLTEKEKEKLVWGLEQRIQARLPVPYITHRTLYGGYEFYIDQRALIPRSPIAELIEKDLMPYWQGQEPERILDLCCGSGCIGILAKYRYPEAEVVLADIDLDALEVAEINLERAGMQSCGIEVCHSDTFEAVTGTFDWILCNPPYVEAEEMQEIADEYRHEPIQALVSGEYGLDLTQKILHQAADYLTENGILILEVGMTWPILEEVYPEIGFDWVEFERGGEGVFAVGRDELLAWREAGLI